MKNVRLNNGVMMPVMGYGVWQIKPEERETIRRLDVGHPLAADFNDPVLARGICWGMTSSSIPKGRDSDCRCLYGLYVFEESGKRGRYVRCLYLAARILKQDLCFDGYSAMS